MKSQSITKNCLEADVEALAVAVYKNEKATSAELKDLDKMTGGAITSVIKSEEFEGNKGDTAYFVFEPKGKGKSRKTFACWSWR